MEIKNSSLVRVYSNGIELERRKGCEFIFSENNIMFISKIIRADSYVLFTYHSYPQ